MNIILDKINQLCTGCGACKNICPVGAIEIKENADGFLFPTIDEKKCIKCNKCKKICPINKSNFNNNQEPECLAIWANNNIRVKCSSGGVFGAIATKFLENGDYICGAVYKDINHVEHILTNNISDLDKIIGSKYVQSDTKNCYNEIKSVLSFGKKVLFCGCPCQIAGLYNVVGYDKNLYTMDLICHGVPSYKFYRKYLKQYSGIESIDFRDKSVFGWSTEINIKNIDGTKINKRHEQDTFYKGFLPCLVQRQSCGNCKFSVLPRQADLTIGDFWGIEKYNKDLNDKLGTSVVLVNNNKGKELLDNYKSQFSLIEKVPIEEALRINKNIKTPFKAHHSRDRFFRDFDVVKNLDRLVDDCLNTHYDVGIVGLWFGLNFGSVLTYYALYKVINELGYSALMINKPDFMWISRYENPNTIAQRFIRKHCNVSLVRNKNNLSELSNHCDSFVVGSDVVWNYDICGKTAGQFLFLDFVDNKCKKISYASSLGTGYNAPAYEHALSKYYLNKFDAISVREKEAADICKDSFNVDADLVMDPVFLNNRQDYKCLVEQSSEEFPQHFIGTYILGPDERKKQMLLKLKENYNLPFRIMPNPNNDEGIKRLGWDNENEILHNGEVEDFLACIDKCDYFFADSFHGLCFAIIFKKQFVVVTGKFQKDNCRFKNLLKTIDCSDRLIFIEDFMKNPNLIIEKMNQKIDYNKVDRILDKKVKESKIWLKDALVKDKITKVDISDYLINCIKKQEIQLNSLKEKNNYLHSEINNIYSYISGFEFKSITDAKVYLKNLNINKKNKILLFACCDTLGHKLNEEYMKLLEDIGIKENLINQHWKGYVSIINDGKIIKEILAKHENESVNLDITINDMDIKMKSAPYNVGNVAEIIINNINYAVNSRGINIVVFDKKLKRVVDSVSIDTHSDIYLLTRK